MAGMRCECDRERVRQGEAWIEVAMEGVAYERPK